MPRVGVLIVHAPNSAARRRMLARLLYRLGADPIQDGAGIHVEEDTTGQGCWRTVRKGYIASGLHLKGATHVVHLADDMWPCSDFWEHVNRIVELLPDHPVNLFHIGTKAKPCLATGSHWFVSASGVWGGTMLLPVRIVRDFVPWEARYCDQRLLADRDDSRLGIYLKLHRETVWTTVPSLVQHIASTDSLMGHNSRRAVSRVFYQTAGPIDWTQGLRNPIRVPDFMMESTRQAYRIAQRQMMIDQENMHAR